MIEIVSSGGDDGVTETGLAAAMAAPGGNDVDLPELCTKLIALGEIERRGAGSDAEPYTYHLPDGRTGRTPRLKKSPGPRPIHSRGLTVLDGNDFSDNARDASISVYEPFQILLRQIDVIARAQGRRGVTSSLLKLAVELAQCSSQTGV